MQILLMKEKHNKNKSRQFLEQCCGAHMHMHTHKKSMQYAQQLNYHQFTTKTEKKKRKNAMIFMHVTNIHTCM